MTELDKAYNPKAVQDRINAKWDAAKAWHAEPDTAADPYVIVIPPPNVTAALHMGHALNNTLQDILVRWRRMQGRNAVWIPGTDHAGIATQTVVEKRVMQEEGKRRIDFDRDTFVAKIQAWKDEYEAVITGQLKAMGSSCDWDRQRFTMDETCARAVREAFFRLFKAGLIYRGKRLVNWDPVTQTALADDEVEMQEVDGHFWYLKYPLVADADDQSVIRNPQSEIEYVTVATTRPETMLGDTAVAVNPKDPQRAKYIGKSVRLPIVNRVIPIIGDDYVVMPLNADAEPARPGAGEASGTDAKAKYASGFLKVTPAHDPNDYDIGQRHNLPIINVMAPDGTISNDHGWPAEEWDDANAGKQESRKAGNQNSVDPFAHHLLGMDRYEAREAIVSWFREKDLLADVKPYTHSVGHSYRSHVPIEPYLSDQWYVKVTDPQLAGAALDAMARDQRSAPFSRDPQGSAPPDASDGALRFFPARYAKTFETWHQNIRDWCISRQLWWGHRIPVWTWSPKNYRDVPDTPENREKVKLDLETATKLFKQLPQEHPDDVAVPRGPMFRSMPNLRGRTTVDRPPDIRDDGSRTVYLSAEVVIDPSFRLCIRDDNSALIPLIESVGYQRDPDVLDTWFSSGLWPISTLGWPDDTAEVAAWNPSSTLCTAREIITLWVSRMVMFNLFFRGCLPFRDVFIHAMIQDGEGQKMSKSLGNGVDPLDIIHSHGADAMRFTLAQMTTQTQDVRMPVDTVCPHCGEAFGPKTKKTKAGHTVAAPTQECPKCGKAMTTSYGVASGEAKATSDAPVARNSSPKFDNGRNFANKIWNAGRFALSKLGGQGRGAHSAPGDSSPRALADRWILNRLARTIADIDKALGEYQFNRYADAVYDFFWRDLCDWYLEAIKPVVNAEDEAGAAARATLGACLDAALRLMHPVMPYVSEALWEKLNEVCPSRGVAGLTLEASELCMTAKWPSADAALVDDEVETAFELTRNVVVAIRNVRNEHNVPPRQVVTVSIRSDTRTFGRDGLRSGLEDATALIQTLAGAKVVAIGAGVTASASGGAITIVVGDVEVYIEGLVDAGAEQERKAKRREELSKSIAALRGRLGNKGYTDKAPAHLVQQTREQLAEAERELGAMGG